MTDATVLIEQEVRDLVRRHGVDPARDGGSALNPLIDEAIGTYEARLETTGLPRISDPALLKNHLLERIAGFGPLQRLMDDPDVEEIWFNGPGRTFCARAGTHVLTSVVIEEREIRELVERMLRFSGRRLDLSSPFVDATLPDGSRLHVAIPDITRRHWAVNIRKFILRAHKLDELVHLGSLGRVPARFLAAAVKAGANILVSGGTQTGKTTMLNCLAGAIPAGRRVVTCEEVFELQLPLPDVVAMQTRPANLEGEGRIDLRRLVVEALRMRPDRIVLGEVRGPEALDLLVALNSGLPGMASIHANSALEAVTKLTTLPLLAGDNVTHRFVVPTIAGAVDLIVHLGFEDGRRITREVLALTGRVEADRVEAARLFERRDGHLRWTGVHPPHPERYSTPETDLVALLLEGEGL